MTRRLLIALMLIAVVIISGFAFFYLSTATKKPTKVNIETSATKPANSK